MINIIVNFLWQAEIVRSFSWKFLWGYTWWQTVMRSNCLVRFWFNRELRWFYAIRSAHLSQAVMLLPSKHLSNFSCSYKRASSSLSPDRLSQAKKVVLHYGSCSVFWPILGPKKSRYLDHCCFRSDLPFLSWSHRYSPLKLQLVTFAS